MIHVDPVEPDDEGWRAWRKEANDEAALLTSADAIKPDLYKRGRKLVLDLLLFGKCAYCEVKVTADQIMGDVDHFRPKGSVRDKDDRKVENHSGYFWLAYEWLNLLPSCISCNRPHRDAQGWAAGKSDRFPLEDENKRARKRGDRLDDEKPLLLNPFIDDPAEHLKFDPDLGTVSGTTDRGRETVKILDLNREGLVDERRQRATAAEDAFNLYVQAVQLESPKKAMKLDEVKRFKNGSSPFSAIARQAIERIRQRVLSEV
jgi:uncharacterized protein (TIGR02646 family)